MNQVATFPSGRYIRVVGIAYTVQQLAMGCRIRGSNTGVCETFHDCPDQYQGSPNLLYNGSGSLLGVTQQEHGVDHTPVRAPRLLMG